MTRRRLFLAAMALAVASLSQVVTTAPQRALAAYTCVDVGPVVVLNTQVLGLVEACVPTP